MLSVNQWKNVSYFYTSVYLRTVLIQRGVIALHTHSNGANFMCALQGVGGWEKKGVSEVLKRIVLMRIPREVLVELFLLLLGERKSSLADCLAEINLCVKLELFLHFSLFKNSFDTKRGDSAAYSQQWMM